MKARIAVLVVLMVAVAAVLAGAGWWYVKDRTRISQDELQATVVRKSGGDRATCVRTDANAAHWLCVVTGSGPERCFRAHVRPWGSVTVRNAYQKCSREPDLESLLTKPKSTSTAPASS